MVLRLLKNTNLLRLLFLMYFVVIYLIRINMLFVYATVFYFSFEWLNANKRFLALQYKTLYNIVIVSFSAYILLVRSQVLSASESVIFHLNTLEHVLFALVICLHLSIYVRVFVNRESNTLPQLLLVVVAFNGIGIVNEFFQNYFNGAPPLPLTPNSLKDLTANLLGTFIYAALAVFHKDTRSFFLVSG